ncbi:prepilin-type N-terminal cleavage/methylation domain-containing protein [Clostridium paraputrificum]|uniref:prepilin-type N-terminal cleavage/methylation domain-containing protein n=1 Tax=Clostridium paraputrificum TaxID=29363 RepID=UPI00189A253A|nr:prepilin-type N-terminal cleavage/methylation domain-containing protein [Clostridium paraputrificum]MDB2123752.1 prepilin-type N-terminal cleavage/methylation domain-containing protein [Clostridium paraputrificum]
MKNKKGFTLIEVVVALAAFMVIMLTITSILVTVIGYSKMNNKNYNLAKMSQGIYEVTKEKKVSLRNTDDPSMYEGGFVFYVNDEDDLKSELRNELFRNAGSEPNPEAYSSTNKRYTVGVRVKWNDGGSIEIIDPGTGLFTGRYHIGSYIIESYTYDTSIGEESLLKRVSRIPLE